MAVRGGLAVASGELRRFQANVNGAGLRYLVTQSLATATWTPIQFNVNYWGMPSVFNQATNATTFTATVSGLYLATLTGLSFAANGTGNWRVAGIFVNGQEIVRQNTSPLPSTLVPFLCVSAVLSLSKGAAVTFQAYQDSGAALNINVLAPYAIGSLVLIG